MVKVPPKSSLAPSNQKQLFTSELSIEEVMLKKENDLSLARESIKKLQSHLGTITISEEEKDGIDSVSDNGQMESEVSQQDSFFAHQCIFQTNVRQNMPYKIVFGSFFLME